jgi:predicted RNase H-like HicB family nuclease
MDLGTYWCPIRGKKSSLVRKDDEMANEFTVVIERDDKWFIAYYPEVPGANGQGKTKEEAVSSVAEAIGLILEDRRDDGLRAVPKDALVEKVSIR